jgi:hypothetical protein
VCPFLGNYAVFTVTDFYLNVNVMTVENDFNFNVLTVENEPATI